LCCVALMVNVGLWTIPASADPKKCFQIGSFSGSGKRYPSQTLSLVARSTSAAIKRQR
jgi:hypothetical protein